MDSTQTWYEALEKPFFAPPPFVFGIAWSILYPIIFLTFGYVFFLAVRGRIRPIITVPFALNLVFNLIFSPIQFWLQNNLLAAIDITLVVITLIWAMKAIYPHYKWIAYLQIPYLLWGLFATILQYSITVLNFSGG